MYILQVQNLRCINLQTKNPAIWSAVSETCKRIFPTGRTIFVSVPFTIGYHPKPTGAPHIQYSNIDKKNITRCIVQTPKLQMFHFMLNGTRLIKLETENLWNPDLEGKIKFHSSNAEGYIIRSLQECARWPLLISPLHHLNNPEVLVKQNVVIILKLANNDSWTLRTALNVNLYRFTESPAFTQGSRFLIVVLEVSLTRELIYQIFRQMSAHKASLTDVYVLTQDATDDSVKLFTSYPYEPPSGKCGKFSEAVLVDIWVENANGGRFVNNSDINLNKAPKQLQNCCIHLKLDEGVKMGIEKEIARVVAKKLSGREETCFSYIVLHPRSGDMVFQPELAVRFYTYTLRFVVPLATSNVAWSLITKVFTMSLWLVVIFCLFCAAFVLKCLAVSSLNKQNSGYNGIVLCLMNTWSALLGIGVSTMPLHYPIRIFFFSWVMYSLCVNTIFQTFFNSYFIVPGRQHQVDSVKELEELNTTLIFHDFGTVYRFISFYGLGDRTYFMYLLNAFPYFFSTPNTALFTNDFEFSYFKKTLCRDETSFYHHKFSGDLMQMNDDIFINDPLLRPRFNSLIFGLVEGGITEKMMMDMFNPTGNTQIMNKMEEFYPLSMIHLSSAFILLITLHVFSCFIFVVECFASCCRSNL
ncbi:Ionotropic receptor 786 [Blattella germanica]|nr:Ionotropic receptor 786 [Blattella germanica]